MCRCTKKMKSLGAEVKLIYTWRGVMRVDLSVEIENQQNRLLYVRVLGRRARVAWRENCTLSLSRAVIRQHFISSGRSWSAAAAAAVDCLNSYERDYISICHHRLVKTVAFTVSGWSWFGCCTHPFYLLRVTTCVEPLKFGGTKCKKQKHLRCLWNNDVRPGGGGDERLCSPWLRHIWWLIVVFCVKSIRSSYFCPGWKLVD